jgi:transcriptional regulator with XRE-family HTH domain
MKQPELGIKISELRKAKGLTQEELVEKCNISVRTIQRIETGEVTPRMYTVKTILAALDHDLNTLSSDDDDLKESFLGKVKRLMLIEPELDGSSYLLSQLNISWVAGIVYFVLGFFEAAAEYSRFTSDELPFGNGAYILIKVFTLISYVFFVRGLLATGVIFGNYLLKVVSLILIGATTLMIAYDIISTFYAPLEREAVVASASVTFGGIGFIFGVALRRLERSLGRVAEFAGILEIMAACFFITIFFGFMGLIVQTPAVLLEILVIYKTMESVKAKASAIA